MINAQSLAYYNRFVALLQHKDKYAALLQPKADLQAEFAIIEAVVAALDPLFTANAHSTKGVTQQKDFHYARMIEIAHPLMLIVKRNAVQDNDFITAQKFTISYSSLLRGNQTKGRNLCDELLAYALTNLPALAVYDVDNALLADLSAKINAFDAAEKPKTARSETVANNQLIKTNIARGNQAIAALKDFTVRLKGTQPDFYNGFLTAIKIDEPHTASLGVLQGKVSTLGTHKAVANAKVSVYLLDATGAKALVATLQTDQSGKFSLSLQPSTYQIEVNADNFAAYIAQKSVRHGANKLGVKLQAA